MSLSVSTGTPPGSEMQLDTKPRGIWTNITSFHKHWKNLSGTQLHNDLLILSDIDSRWILHPERYWKEHQVAALRDQRFCSLLQWKLSTGHIHCFLNNDSFWIDLNYQLTECLPDPTTNHTANYDPLILDEAHYRMAHCHCHGANKRLIITLLRGGTLSAEAITLAIKQIIHQSIPTLVFINDSGIRSEPILKISIPSKSTVPIVPQQKVPDKVPEQEANSKDLTDDQFIDSMLDDELYELFQ